MNLAQKTVAWMAKSFGLTDVTTWRRFASGDTYAGKPVNTHTALQVATVWACIRLISETISTLPLITYQRNGSGGRDVARDHWLYALLHDAPNANMTAVEFWEAVVAHLCLWGNSYWLKTYIGKRVVSLELLRPDRMEVKLDKDGFLVYAYSDQRHGYKEYTEDEIAHLKGFGVNGLIGLSPIAYARNSLSSAMAADEASGRVFANGMRAGGALHVKDVLKPNQRTEIRESLAEQLAGTANSGKLMVLEGGMEYQPLSINPDDAQMLETRAFNIEEICRWFRVPPFMVGHSEKSTSWGTGLEQQMQGFLTFSLRPYLTRIEQCVSKSLLSPVDRLKYYAEFSLEGLMRADSAGRASLYASAAQNGWMSRNEIRELENRPPMEGGDTLTVQSNLLPIDQLGKQTDGTTAQDALKSWLGIEGARDES
jgi:HK97 family phage portal protein